MWLLTVPSGMERRSAIWWCVRSSIERELHDLSLRLVESRELIGDEHPVGDLLHTLFCLRGDFGCMAGCVDLPLLPRPRLPVVSDPTLGDAEEPGGERGVVRGVPVSPPPCRYEHCLGDVIGVVGASGRSEGDSVDQRPPAPVGLLQRPFLASCECSADRGVGGGVGERGDSEGHGSGRVSTSSTVARASGATTRLTSVTRRNGDDEQVVLVATRVGDVRTPTGDQDELVGSAYDERGCSEGRPSRSCVVPRPGTPRLDDAWSISDSRPGVRAGRDRRGRRAPRRGCHDARSARRFLDGPRSRPELVPPHRVAVSRDLGVPRLGDPGRNDGGFNAQSGDRHRTGRPRCCWLRVVLVGTLGLVRESLGDQPAI